MVSVGFWHADDTNDDPSATTMLETSCDWQNGFSTDFFGSVPMRAVPTSWIAIPGISVPVVMRMFLAPAASSISAALTAASCIIAFSLAPCAMLMRSAGIPQASFKFGSISQKLSKRASDSPNAPRDTSYVPCFTALLYVAPMPGAPKSNDGMEEPWYP